MKKVLFIFILMFLFSLLLSTSDVSQIVEEGFGLYFTGYYDEAIEKLNYAIELDPKNSVAHNYLGLIYHEKGETDKALPYYKKSVKFDSKK